MKALSLPLALLSSALLLTSGPLAAQEVEPVRLSMEHRTLVRCSAAFAIVAHGQAVGNAQANAYPALGTRGQEFFVRTGAQVMDEAQISYEQLAATMQVEAQELWDSGEVDQIMPVCLQLLEQSGL